MRRLSLVLACCVLPPGTAYAQQRAVTLAEAIQLAERAAPAVVSAEGTARAAGSSVRAAWGEYLPRITGTSGFQRSFSALPSRTDPITGEVISGNQTSGSVSLGASASVELFTGFRRGADLSVARAGVADADAGLAYERSQSALNTTTEFLRALQSADLVRVSQESIRRVQEKVAIANVKLATRSATIADSLQAVVDLARARGQLLNNQQALAAAEASLARLVGFDGRVAAVRDSSLFATVAIADSAALMSEAMARSPSVVRADARVRSSRASLTITRAGYFPSVVVSGSTSYSGSSSGNYSLLANRGLNLSLSWPIFNGFARERDMAQRRASLDGAEATAADARRQVGATLITQLGALRTAEQRVLLTTQSLDAARASAQVQTERYRLGSIGIVELNAAQEALSNAETDGVTARYDYLRAKAQIEAILGRKM